MNHGVEFSERPTWASVAFGVVLMLSGCSFDQLQRTEQNDIQRVEQKQAALQAEQGRAAALKRQEEQLASELSERQLSLSELNERVLKIQAANGRSLADNEQKRNQYGELIRQVHETNEQLASLAPGLADSVEERRERIALLKTRLKAQLDLLLH